MDQEAPITVERSDPAVAVVTLDRPDQKNAMSLAMWLRLGEIFRDLGATPEIRAIILTGNGGSFCAGADIKEFGKVRADASSAAAYAEAVESCNHAIFDAPKAVFAACSGPVMGGGCGLALCCDFRIADRTAYFGIPAARLGLVYGVLETHALMQTVGLTAAKDILFSARRIPAEEALGMGLATEVADDALATAKARAEALKASAPLSIAGSKAVLAGLLPQPDAETGAVIAEAQRRAARSEDYREGVRAFGEKRPPVFAGR